MRTLESGVLAVHPVLWTVPWRLRGHVWRRLAVSEKHRYLYVRIPKAANSTIMRTLAEHTFPARAQEVRADGTGRRAKHMFDQPSPFGCLTTRCLTNRYFTFSFFRNPLTRLLSAYLDKLQSEPSYRKYQWVAGALGLEGSARDVTFPDFVEFLERGGLRMDIHWAPQTEICPIPIDRLGFCGRIEELDGGLEQVISRTFGSVSYRGMNPREHNQQGASDRIDGFYTADLEARVRALYSRDFDVLAYD